METGQNSVGIGVSSNPSDVRIYNGTVRDFYIGIDLTGTLSSRLDDVTVLSTVARGIVISSGSVLEDCLVASGQGEGIVMQGQGSVVSRCHVAANLLNGVFIVGFENVVQDSTFDINGYLGGDASGVRVFDSDNVVRHNTFIEGPLDMYITGARTIVQDNTGCQFVVKDSTGTTTYANNVCQTIVP